MNLSELSDSFDLVHNISLDRNNAGLVDLKMPQSRYDKSDEYTVHEYGWGPFCEFSLETSEYANSEGVYVFTAGNDIMYVGETVDLHNRMQAGYGNISPKNCFEGGQQTNCRVNHLILETVRNRVQVSLWFEETQRRNHRETELIEECDPPWNKTSKRSASESNHQANPQKPPSQSTKEKTTGSSVVATEATRNGKYKPLYDYLEGSDSDTLDFTMDEIEVVIDGPVPHSGRTYPAYWNENSQAHAKVWGEMGWVATPDFEDMTVTFEKVKE